MKSSRNHISLVGDNHTEFRDVYEKINTIVANVSDNGVLNFLSSEIIEEIKRGVEGLFSGKTMMYQIMFADFVHHEYGPIEYLSVIELLDPVIEKAALASVNKQTQLM